MKQLTFDTSNFRDAEPCAACEMALISGRIDVQMLERSNARHT